MAIFFGFKFLSGNQHDPQNEAADGSSTKLVQRLVQSEELLLELTPVLRSLSRSVRNLELPDQQSREVFAEQVEVVGSVEMMQTEGGGFTGSQTGQSETTAIRSNRLSGAELALWPELFNGIEYFEQAKFYFVRGKFKEDSQNQFQSTVGFQALAKQKKRAGTEQLTSNLHGELEIQWGKSIDSQGSEKWQINHWKLIHFESTETPALLFRNVLEDVLENRSTFTRATVSKHTALTSQLMSGEEYFFPPGETYPLFFPDVTLEHPGISVVDINSDGFDDIYIAMQHDANLLFRNKGDGTFEEVAKNYGLDIVGDSTSAIFADFDNDGDPDLFLGRARRKSKYFVNLDGQFIDQTKQLITGDLPALVSSITAADYDNDGLLDVYLCTYSPIEEANRFQVANKPMWLDLFLTPQQGEKVSRLNRKSHRFTDRAGPPNLLLKNVGYGRFEPAKENEQLELWRMTFQASWNDFDRDGDQDLYVANDYAPDNLFRNDGQQGFTDITNETGLTGLGFGMGVSWGDYDNDGQTDLYVTNMYSKAGQRITGQVADLDPRIREMAKGNFLYRCDGGKFSMVSGSEKTDMKVAKSGWSWGGQFLDFDNDGFRDIYATSGYYTAPADIAVDIDL